MISVVNEEWAQDEETPITVDKTFLQMLMEDEIDFDRESALDKQEIEADRNCAVRQLITDQLPALAVITTAEVFKQQIIPLFSDLCCDSMWQVRASCA